MFSILPAGRYDNGLFYLKYPYLEWIFPIMYHPAPASGSPSASWAPMQPGHLPAVAALAARMHPGCPERAEVLDERRSLCPAGCQVLVKPDGQVRGYMLSHPWHMAHPPALDTLLGRLPARPDCWYLHDIAIDPALRGQGHAHAALRHLGAQARLHGVKWLALMAAEGARALWAHLGFAPIPEVPAAITVSYGADACPMRRAADIFQNNKGRETF
ncbi:GNAT family N-acetyltransferase [Komagataeibacter xylinus]|uniref:GNAT family N-acetyltransferase n=1 Tax=Komagataeibacter xylinus TaxID=28448 RepID=UPI001F5E8317|nr:GNAT family N-acetyltransferase [Komagataeibacter xylinus]